VGLPTDAFETAWLILAFTASDLGASFPPSQLSSRIGMANRPARLARATELPVLRRMSREAVEAAALFIEIDSLATHPIAWLHAISAEELRNGE
jgi:hypothetical protein